MMIKCNFMGENVRKIVSSDRFILFMLAVIYVSLASYFGVISHYTFSTNAWDLGIYAQALYTTLNYGKILYYTVEAIGNPSRSLFGIHFSPFLFLILPIYAIYQNPVTLLILRQVAISMGLIPLYLILRESGIKSKALTIFLATAYLVYPPMMIPVSNFDVSSFLPSLFLFALHYIRKQRYLRAYPFIILALMVNEFVPFIIAAMAFYCLILDWRKNYEKIKCGKITKNILFALSLLALSGAWFLLASKVITYFNPSALETKWEWGDLGSSPGEIIVNSLSNPVKAIMRVFNDGERKFLYLIALLGPLAFIPLLDPTALIMALPWLAASFLSINPLYYSILTQYPAFVSAFVFLSAVDGIKRLKNINMNILKRIVLAMSITLLISTLLIPSNIQIKYGGKRGAIYQLALSEIPPNASISVMPEIFPHVCNRLEVYPYFNESVEYVLIDVYSWWYDVYLPRPTHLAPRWCDAKIGEEYGIILNMDGVILYKKGYGGPVKNFSGVSFTYTVDNVSEYFGKAFLVQEGEVFGRILVHEAGSNAPLLFKTPRKILPPGIYNVTTFLKVSSAISEDLITFEVREVPGDIELLVKRFSGESLLDNAWKPLSFSFTLKKPALIEIAAYVDNSTDIYFQSLRIVQVSGGESP